MLFAILLLGIWDTIHFTSRDIGYCVQYFVYFQGYGIFREINNGDICQFYGILASLAQGIFDISSPPIQASSVY